MSKARLFNYRPMCFVVLFLSLGIIVAEALYSCNKLYYLIPTVLSILVIIGLFLFRKSRKFGYMAVAFLLGFLALTCSNDLYDRKYVDDMSNITIQGKVDSEILIEDGKTSFYIDDIYVDGETYDGRAYILFYATDTPDYNAGDVVYIAGNMFFNSHEKFSTYYSSNYTHKNYYFIYANSVSKVAEGSVGFPTNLQLKIKQMFYENTDSKTAMICQALVLGDKNGFDDDLYDNIKSSGLAHVLAVSGLHITTLATALYFLLKKLKVNPKLSLMLVTILTFVYSMLCSFTPSSLRAFVMTFVLNLTSAYGLKQDNLSSWSLAGSVLLIINPTNILSIGYLLSMFSVLGIFLFYKQFAGYGMKVIDKISPKRHIGKSVVEGSAVALASNLTTAPFVSVLFGSVPVLFMLSSVIILPYLMFIYLFLLFITLFALITTLWSATICMQPLLFPFVKWVEFIGSISWSSIGITLSVVFAIFWLIGCILSSRFVFLNKRVKATIAVLGLSAYLICEIVCAVLQA